MQGVRHLLPSCGPEPSFAALTGRKVRHFLKTRSSHWREDELGDALSSLECNELRTEVGDDEADLAAIVAVDGAGSVHDGEPLVVREPAANSDLAFITLGNCDRDTRR